MRPRRRRQLVPPRLPSQLASRCQRCRQRPKPLVLEKLLHLRRAELAGGSGAQGQGLQEALKLDGLCTETAFNSVVMSMRGMLLLGVAT